jgi:hypothetical protein
MRPVEAPVQVAKTFQHGQTCLTQAAETSLGSSQLPNNKRRDGMAPPVAVEIIILPPLPFSAGTARRFQGGLISTAASTIDPLDGSCSRNVKANGVAQKLEQG